jgi:menaquinone-dependent protoporphyrinogen IX oxidase
MKNIAVIYKSIYGTTKQYAEWIAEELNASLFEVSTVKPARLMDYDVVVYGGGLYAGGIAGIKLVLKNQCKSLVVFTVGLATPEITNYSDILTKTFTTEYLKKTKVFHLHGGMDYAKLSMVHKAMMAFKKKEVEKTPLAERTSDDHALLETYGGKFDFSDRETIKPLIDYVSAL